MRLVSSLTPTADASDDPSTTPMKMFTSGCTIVRNAGGRITYRSDCVNVKPSERAASACPTGTVLIPPRTASQTNAAPNAAMHSAADVNSENVIPMSGRPNTTRISSVSSGMFRNTWTYTAPTQRSGATGLTRNTASTVPSSSAPMKPSTVSSSVTSSPPSRNPRLSVTTRTAESPQEPGTEPIAGGAGGSPATTLPMVAFQSFAQLPSA